MRTTAELLIQGVSHHAHCTSELGIVSMPVVWGFITNHRATQIQHRPTISYLQWLLGVAPMDRWPLVNTVLRTIYLRAARILMSIILSWFRFACTWVVIEPWTSDYHPTHNLRWSDLPLKSYSGHYGISVDILLVSGALCMNDRACCSLAAIWIQSS